MGSKVDGGRALCIKSNVCVILFRLPSSKRAANLKMTAERQRNMETKHPSALISTWAPAKVQAPQTGWKATLGLGSGHFGSLESLRESCCGLSVRPFFQFVARRQVVVASLSLSFQTNLFAAL